MHALPNQTPALVAINRVTVMLECGHERTIARMNLARCRRARCFTCGRADEYARFLAETPAFGFPQIEVVKPTINDAPGLIRVNIKLPVVLDTVVFTAEVGDVDLGVGKENL